MTTLFKNIPFISHSGQSLDWKIDCDSLTNEDLDTLARLVSTKIKFGEVIGIPTGGLRFANTLKKYITRGNIYLLVVDDVLTTGKSMKEYYNFQGKPTIGVVIFARTQHYPIWITPIFELAAEWSL